VVVPPFYNSIEFFINTIRFGFVCFVWVRVSFVSSFEFGFVCLFV